MLILLAREGSSLHCRYGEALSEKGVRRNSTYITILHRKEFIPEIFQVKMVFPHSPPLSVTMNDGEVATDAVASFFAADLH